MNINYKSDFDCILTVKDCKGNDIGFPDFDFEAKFYTRNFSVYMVSSLNGVLTNCFNDNGKIHCVFQNHKLGPGKLMVEFHSIIPDSIYQDEVKDIYSPQETGITLISGKGDCTEDLEMQVMPNIVVIKSGDGGISTPEGWDELKEKIEAKLDSMQKLEDSVSTAETKRISSELHREEAFQQYEQKIDGKMDKFITGQGLSLVGGVLSVTGGGISSVGDDTFIKMWTYAGGNYNEDTGFFELNGITDIGLEEAMKIYRMSEKECRQNWESKYATSINPGMKTIMSCRTYFPLLVNGYSPKSFKNTFYGNTVEVVCIKGGYDANGGGINISFSETPFYGCKNLKTVMFGNGNALASIQVNDKSFYACENIERISNFRLASTKQTLNLSYSPKFKIDCIETSINLTNKPTGTDTNTYILHPDVYAQCSDELLAAALAKNIIITTTN